MTTTQTQNNEVAEEIFNQLKASSVNGFPFFAYTGAKPQIFSETALYLKTPRNPKGVKNVLIQYEYDSDLYTIIFNGKDRHEEIFAEDMVELIVREMGVN